MTTPQNETQTGQLQSAQFSIRSIMVITLIMAVASTAMGQLWRVANGQVQDVGPFILVTSMAPLGVMIATYWLFRLIGKL